MFSVFKNEWVKILFNKKTVVTIIIMLAADVFMLLIYLSKDDISYRTYTDYKEAALLGGTELADIQEGEYDETVFNYIIGEMSSAESYASYVENTIDGADASMNISIFMNEFDINNAAKTKEDYAILKNADVRFVGGYGIEKLMGFPAAEIIIVLLLCVAVSHLVIDEKKSGMMSMLKPTKHGGVALVSAKMSAAAFYGAFLSAVLSLANICIVITLYGKVDMSANIQSVKMFRGCGTDISIGHFLLYYILIKCLAYVFVAVLFTAAAVACSNHIYFYVVCAGMAALSVIFFYAGSFETGNMFLRRMNIIYYLSGGKMFLYFNYNIFNNPVHILTANILVMIVGIIFCAATAVVLYARATTDYRQFSFPIRIKGRSRIYGLWTLENYKFYAGYRVAVVFIAAVITQLYIYHGKEVHWYADEIMYRNYICSIEGEYTEEKRDYIYGELETANEAVKRADELDKLLLAGEITEDEFNREYQSIEGWLNKQYPL